MSKSAKEMIPNIPVNNLELAEKTLYENFKILADLLKGGVDGSITTGGHTYTFTKGILTSVT
jgi:hypothetical protein